MLEARLSGIQPDIARLYNDGKPGELMPDGKPSGIFMELALTADKPFERKVNGLLAHNAIYFGQPLCDCDESKIYNLTFCKKTHYNQITFEMMCHRAHVPTCPGKRCTSPSHGSGRSSATAAERCAHL